MDDLDLTPALGTPEERIKHLQDVAMRFFRERNQLRSIVDAVWPLFDPHGPVTGSSEWQAAWSRAENLLKEAE